MSGLVVLLSRIKLTQDVIILTECCLTSNPRIPSIEGYDNYSSSTTMNKKDGVVYVRNDINDVIVTQPAVMNLQ